MTDFNTDMNVQFPKIEPITLIDEVSSTEFYIGISKSGNSPNRPIWQIKKILKTGNVWNVTLYPNGNQTSGYAWSGRTGYSYL